VIILILTAQEKEMLSGKEGMAVQKSMEILTALGEIFGAEKLVPVNSVQIAGVSYHNLGDAGLEFLEDMARDGKVRIRTMLNPAGMDLENWKDVGIPADFAEKQMEVIDAFRKLGVTISCTCTPYLIGYNPKIGEHISWSESSAVCFSNSVMGARTNKEGGPSALAAAITGRTPLYGLHMDANRAPKISVDVQAEVKGEHEYGALALAIGKQTKEKIPLIRGIKGASLEELKSFSASFPTYSGAAMFHMEGITPDRVSVPAEEIVITQEDVEDAIKFLNDECEVDFVSVGCPHCSMAEMGRIASLLKGRKVSKETWITTSRQMKGEADKKGWTRTIEASGAKIVCDTCLAVAPLKGRFKAIATNSAKGCYYGRGSNGFKTRFMSLEECIGEATRA
jgi:predicted aconitase